MPRSLQTAVGLLLLLVPTATGQVLTRVSLGSGGVQPNSASNQGQISPDGRFVAFRSLADNLAVGDVNGAYDVFLRDLLTGTTELVSLDSQGVHGNLASRNPSLSANGRFVFFVSFASNLVPNDTNGADDLFVRDRQLGTTTRISVTAGGVQASGSSSAEGNWTTPSGRFVVFTSTAANLVPNDVNASSDVFLRDNATGAIELLSISSTGMQGDGESQRPSISDDGRFVVFESRATNLVPNDSNGAANDVFVRDRLNGTTALVDVSSSGVQANGPALAGPVISGDGRFVAFTSWFATNLVPGAGGVQIYLRDLVLSTTTLVSADSSGQPADDRSYSPVISRDGRRVFFASEAYNLGNANFCGPAVYLRDMTTGITSAQDFSTMGYYSQSCSTPNAISADGRRVVFSCGSIWIEPEDTNHVEDVFLRDTASPWSYQYFCLGNGAMCPCPGSGNGSNYSGCGYSPTNSIGAALLGLGAASVSADTFTLFARFMPPSTPHLYFQGTSALGGGVGVPFGDGLRCVGGSTTRLAVRTADAIGSSHFGAAVPGDPPISQLGSIPASGGTRYYQVWFRDAGVFCTPSTFNLSSGLVTHWSP